MKIAVTSANGQLGSSIIKQLVLELGSENVIYGHCWCYHQQSTLDRKLLPSII